MDYYILTIYVLFADQDTVGAESLLKKYISQLCHHASEVLPAASEIAAGGAKHFAAVVAVMRTDVIRKDSPTEIALNPSNVVMLTNLGCPDVLLPELAVCLTLLQQSLPLLLHTVDWLQLLAPLLDALDTLNRLAPQLDAAEHEDLSWPGVPVLAPLYGDGSGPDALPLVRAVDVENNNRDGGRWVRVGMRVYDVGEAK